jgi:uncharacterized protein YegP (UPF0339 family)
VAVRRRGPDRIAGRCSGWTRQNGWAEFKIFQDRDGKYYWHLEAASGRIIAQSGHPCENKYWCEQDVNWLRANAGPIMVYDRTGAPHRLVA